MKTATTKTKIKTDITTLYREFKEACAFAVVYSDSILYQKRFNVKMPSWKEKIYKEKMKLVREIVTFTTSRETDITDITKDRRHIHVHCSFRDEDGFLTNYIVWIEEIDDIGFDFVKTTGL